MAIVNIDGKSYEFEGKHRLLQWCLDNSIEIPYFCYHPAMSVPTNCRMCLVEMGTQARDRETKELVFDENQSPVINWMPKPTTSCNLGMSDGLFIKTHRSSKTIATAQKGVLEYMLINHPLDCPICDQAGECPLQIWTYKYGPEGSRFEALKVHKKKHVELGPRVVLDEERCINCTRCVRFTDEISKSSQLTIVGRGDKNCPGTAPGQSFDDPYSMNTIDICPVGALTSKAHRFKARVWEMAYAPSIDLNDSTGTNIHVWIRDNKVLRITPRKNLDVNQYWMPDAHRLNTALYNDNRANGVKITGDIPVPFADGISKAGALLATAGSDALLLGSAYASLESNFALRQLANQLGVKDVYYVTHVVPGHGDNWLIQDDRTPNAAACELLGFVPMTAAELKTKLAGKVPFLYSLENDAAFATLDAEALSGIPSIVHAAYNHPAYTSAEIVLPAAIAIEAEGTYINKQGKAQVSSLAKQIRQMTPDQWMRLPKSRIDKAAVAVDRWRNLEHIFDVLPSWLLIAQVGRAAKFDFAYTTHADIFPVVQAQFDALAGITVSYLPPKASFKTTQLEFAPKW